MFLGINGIPGALGLPGETGRGGQDGLTGQSGRPGPKVCIFLYMYSDPNLISYSWILR